MTPEYANHIVRDQEAGGSNPLAPTIIPVPCSSPPCDVRSVAGPRYVAIPVGKDPNTCPVLALQKWLAQAVIVDGPVFRPIRKRGAIKGVEGVRPSCRPRCGIRSQATRSEPGS
jgi:hypothetical protein